MKLVFTEIALNQAEQVDTWWRANRPDSRHAFATDFAVAIAVIHSFPLIRPPHDVVEGAVIRRQLVKRTKHHVYYTVEETTQTVRILYVWGGPRGSAPPLPFTG